MKNRFLGIVSLIYAILISYVFLSDKMDLFISKSLQNYILLSIFPLIIMGIILCAGKKKNKLNLPDLILLLPLVVFTFVGDGKLTSSFASNRITEIPKIEIEKNDNNDGLNIIDINDDNYYDYYKKISSEKSNKYVNKKIKLKGLYVINDKNKSYIGKYFVMCCTADASFIGFRIDNFNNQLSKDNMYVIDGILEYKDNTYIIKILDSKKINSDKESIYVYDNLNSSYDIIIFIVVIVLILKSINKREEK